MTEIAVPTLAEEPDLGRGLMGAGLAVTAWAGGSVITKAISMDALAIAVYRFWLFSLLVTVWMVRARPAASTRSVVADRRPAFVRVLRDSMWGGIALGVDVALFFSAIKLTNVVNATLIGSLQPIVVGVIAARFFGERIRSVDAAWSGLALIGVIGVVVASNGTPEWSAAGDLLAVAAMLAWSAYFILSKRSKETLTSLEYTAGTAVWTAAINTPLAIVFGQDLSWPSWTNLGWLVVMTLIAGVIGHVLMNWSLVRIPLWIGSTFTLLIPVAASLLAWVFIGESLSLAQLGPMALVLGALAAIIRGQSRPRLSPPITAPV
jgi:drug/metabolite transporter (DMT)-like permease